MLLLSLVVLIVSLFSSQTLVQFSLFYLFFNLFVCDSVTDGGFSVFLGCFLLYYLEICTMFNLILDLLIHIVGYVLSVVGMIYFFFIYHNLVCYNQPIVNGLEFDPSF